MNALKKLERARDLLVPPLLYSIQTVQLSDEHFTLKITFQNEITLYIKYNDFGEYSYQVLLAQQNFESIRYDNFDDRWDVSTRPNHLHSQGKTVSESPMNGNPKHDVPLLIKELKGLI